VIDNLNKQEYIYILFILSVVTFYFGYIWGGGLVGNGFNVMNFIFLYFIARFIALHTKNENPEKRKKLYLSTYVISSLAIALIAITIDRLPISNQWICQWAYAYSSPLVIISSISFFLLFRTFKISSKFINRLAKSALAVYLIQEDPLVRGHIYEFIHETSVKLAANEWLLLFILPLFAFIMMAGCLLTDSVRLYITNPVEKLLNKVEWGKYGRNISDYLSKRIK